MNEEKNIEDALGITGQHEQSSGIFDKVPGEENKPSSVGDNAAELVLSFVAYAILILGILGSLITAFTVGTHGYHNEASGFLIFIGGTITSVITWAACMVVVNISNNIRQIKHELRKTNPNK